MPPRPASSCSPSPTTTPSAASPRPSPPASSSGYGSSPPSRSPPSTRAPQSPANCTSSATTSITPAPCSPSASPPSSPTASAAPCAWPPVSRRPASSSTKHDIGARIAVGKPIGRPHLAEAVLAAPANASRLAAENIDDIGSLIRGYLIEGKPAFRLRETPTVAQAIEAIHEAGGVAIWAHPFWDIESPDEVLSTIDRFNELGIDGVEAFYITHTEEQTRLVAAHCEELGLLTTGSADYHGPENRLFSQFMAFDTFGLQPNLGPIAG